MHTRTPTQKKTQTHSNTNTNTNTNLGTAYDNGTGAFGYIYEMLPQKIPGGMVTGNESGYQPWWNCKNSVDKINGESGCYPHDYDYGDNEDVRIFQSAFILTFLPIKSTFILHIFKSVVALYI